MTSLPFSFIPLEFILPIPSFYVFSDFTISKYFFPSFLLFYRDCWEKRDFLELQRSSGFTVG